MPTRYEQLRQVVAILGAAAAEQASYLDELMTPVTGGGSAAAYGNDELALSLDDIFRASSDMIRHGELTEEEAALIRPLDHLLTQLSGEDNADFWRREALDADARWADVRALARSALSGLPDEERATGRSTRNGS
jgi:hypothetical protein